jgi:hypothetical protein
MQILYHLGFSFVNKVETHNLPIIGCFCGFTRYQIGSADQELTASDLQLKLPSTTYIMSELRKVSIAYINRRLPEHAFFLIWVCQLIFFVYVSTMISVTLCG